MSLGQTMISAAFFVLLTLAVLSANTMILQNTKYYLQEEATEQGSNFGNALLNEILTKKFDRHVTVDGSGNVNGPYIVWLNASDSVIGPYGSNVPSGMAGPPWPPIPTLFRYNQGPTTTAKNYVMPGGNPDVAPYKSIRGDNTNYFYDVGSYNGYKRTVNSADISGYTLTVNVYYVTKSNDSTAASFQTFYKRIDVTVAHPIYLTKALTFSAIATY